MAKLKFAIIGCGRISKNHIEAIQGNDKASLVALCDVYEQKAIEMNKLYAVSAAIYSDYKEMIQKEKPHVAVICTISGYHAEQAKYCLEHGVHVLVEKPMALSLSDADEMIMLAKKNNVKLAVCHQNRFNPPIQKLRRAIEEGRFGKLVNGTARILWNRNDDYYKQASWRGTWALDGGTLMNQCIHNIDLLQWMLGGEIESVYGQTGTFLRDIEAEDFGAIIVRFKNGCIGVIEGSACVYPKNLEETLSIFGEKGTVVIGGLAVNEIQTWEFSDVKDYDSEDVSGAVEDVYGSGHVLIYEDLITAIEEDREPYVSGEEGRKAIEIVLKVYNSEGHMCG